MCASLGLQAGWGLELYVLRKGGERREGRVIQGIDSFWALLDSWLVCIVLGFFG
jgi:hypothetical protein